MASYSVVYFVLLLWMFLFLWLFLLLLLYCCRCFCIVVVVVFVVAFCRCVCGWVEGYVGVVRARVCLYDVVVVVFALSAICFHVHKVLTVM